MKSIEDRLSKLESRVRFLEESLAAVESECDAIAHAEGQVEALDLARNIWLVLPCAEDLELETDE